MAVRYQDYYKTLGVERGVSDKELHAAFRKLARKRHPDVDKSPGAEARFKDINEAHEVLRDPAKRARYDALGADWQAGQEFTPPPGAGGAAHFGRADFDAFGPDFSDFFASLFGDLGQAPSHARARARGRAGRSHEAEITLTIAELIRGGSREIALESVERDDQGRAHRARRSYDVRIPPGTTEGTLIRLAGQGGPGAGGGPAGDLLLRARIAADERFSVEGLDLHTRVAITPWEAALGARIELPLPAGSATLTVPAGSSSGRKLRLRGQGLPARDGTRGDLTVELSIAVPAELSARERELFTELARASRFDPRV